MSLFRRKALSLDSFTAGDCEQDGFSRLSLVLHADEGTVHQCVAQMGKLIDVVDVQHLPDDDSVRRELALVTVNSSPEKRREILEIAQIMKCEVAHLGHDTLTLECAAETRHLEHLFALLEPYGIHQIVRSGVVAIQTEKN
jgi:acetolactate synthase-1/3 small subunit